jgi:dUTPase
MKYCLTGLSEILIRRERSCGLDISSMKEHVIKFGEISHIKCRFKFKCLNGYYAMLSVKERFAREGLVILNNVITEFKDKPLVISVTSLSKKDIAIPELQYFANMTINEEGDRSTPLRLNSNEWLAYMELMDPCVRPKEVVNLVEYRATDIDECAEVEGETDDDEIEETGSEVGEGPEKKKRRVTYSSDDESEAAAMEDSQAL